MVVGEAARPRDWRVTLWPVPGPALTQKVGRVCEQAAHAAVKWGVLFPRTQGQL